MYILWVEAVFGGSCGWGAVGGGVLYVVYGLVDVEKGGEWRGRREQEIV